MALKLSASGAARIIRQFERHDQEMIERTLKVRHDREALMSVVEQGRQDLEALLAAERGDLDEDELVIS